MDGFQKTVLFVAIVILIISLIIIGFTLSAGQDNNWPPMVPNCPDYWITDGSSNAKCINVKDLGTCPAPSGSKHLTMDFGAAPYVGSNSTCAKYTWATNCGISWDAITYGVSNPCQTNQPQST